MNATLPKGLPMRRQSIFASTKQIVSATASTVEETACLTTDIVKYAREEMRATSRVSKLENTEEYVSTKIQLLRGMYAQLAEVQASDSTTKDLEVALITEAIEEIKAES